MGAVLAMDARGRVTIPKEIREKLSLRAGALLRAEVIGQVVSLRPLDEAPELLEVGGLLLIAAPLDD